MIVLGKMVVEVVVVMVGGLGREEQQQNVEGRGSWARLATLPTLGLALLAPLRHQKHGELQRRPWKPNQHV